MASKIRQRFGGSLFKIPCRIALLAISRVDDLDTEKQFKRIISEINHYPTHGLNCSEITIDGLTMGNSDRTGNYSGLLGMLQRQEVDYAPGLTRLDCLGGSSLRVMAVAGSAEVRIISKKMVPVNQSLEHFEPLIDTMFLFDNYSLFTLFVSVMAVAMVISIGDSKAPRKRFLESALKTLWASFELMVSQGKHRYVTAVQRLPWLHLTAGLFIIISGLFLNLLSTERVAQRELDQIDTFDDLFNKFNGQEPTIMANYFTNGLRHLTRPGTKENALFERIKSNENSTYKFDMKAGSTQELFHITAKKQLDEGRRYLLFEDMMLKPDVFCHILPTMFDKVHMSRDTILDGILAYLYNSESDPMFVKYVSYRLTNKLEFGFFDREVLQSVETLAQITGYWELGKKGATRCRFRDATSKTVADIQFRLGYVRSILYFLASVIFAAIATVIFEIILALPENGGDVKPGITLDTRLPNQIRQHCRGRNGRSAFPFSSSRAETELKSFSFSKY